MASDSPGNYSRSQQHHHHHQMTDGHDCHVVTSLLPDSGARNFPLGSMVGGFPKDIKDSGYYVSTSDGASTCSSSTTETAESEGGTLLVLEPKSLRNFTTNDEYLFAMKEDLADWFSCLYQRDDLTAENFLQVLDTGVLLCKHANKVQEFARQRREMGEPLEMRSYFIRSVPAGNVSYREGVKPETFQARDNVSNFISWGRQLGIPEVLSFETDDLVLRKNEKSVILCLLEIARIGAKLGMLAPTLIQMEQEIDAELAGEEPQPQVQIITCDMRSLDERVRDLIGRCTCPVQFPMVKVGEGKYKIGDTRNLIFVRILRNHVMVRVGGGWDTLENYLNKHDPCQCNYRGPRPSTGNIAYKVAVGQQQQHQQQQQQQQRQIHASTTAASNAIASRQTSAASTAPNTPSSPRRSSTASAAPDKKRSTSPHSTPTPGTKATPALVISRHMPLPSKTGAIPPSSKQQQPPGRSSTSHSQQGSLIEEEPSSLSACARSTSPGSSPHRSPSPRTVSQPPAPAHPQVPSVSVHSRAKELNPDSRKVKPRRAATDVSDRSVSGADRNHSLPTSNLDKGLHSDSTNLPEGGVRAGINLDKINTMTLSEFKSLLHSSSLSTTDEQKLGQGEHSTTIRATSWGHGKEVIAGTDALPVQNKTEEVANWIGRPKTPKNIHKTDVHTGTHLPRSKTPTSLANSKISKASAETEVISGKEEFKMSRPKPISVIKREAVAKVAGAISNCVEGRSDSASSATVPGVPGSLPRPRTLIKAPDSLASHSLSGEAGDHFHVEYPLANSLSPAAFNNPRERPVTPSRIPKPSFIPRPKTPSSLFMENSADSTFQSGMLSQDQHAHQARLNIGASSSKPVNLSRSNSNSSSVKSFDEPVSPASSFSEDRAFKTFSRNRRPSNASENSNTNSNTAGASGRSYKDIYAAKRAMSSSSDGRTLPTRAVTPGPREKWTLGGSIGGGSTTEPVAYNAKSGQRRRSINTCDVDKQALFKHSVPASFMRQASSVSNMESEPQLIITNEITFSDDEEIAELIKNAALKATKPAGVRSTSVDPRKIAVRQVKETVDDVILIQRDSTAKDNQKFHVARRAVSRGSSIGRSSPVHLTGQPSSPTPTSAKQKASPAGKTKDIPRSSSLNAGDKGLSRTEAWVDSTLQDGKKKPILKDKRTKDEISINELVPRPFKEIQAILMEPKNGLAQVDSANLEAPPEDPEMFRKMEKLFEKYREMELKASCRDSPAGRAGSPAKDKFPESQSVKSDGRGSGLRLSKTLTSLKLSDKSSMASSSYSASSPKSTRSHGRTTPVEGSRRAKTPLNWGSQISQPERSSPSDFAALISPSQESFLSEGPPHYKESAFQNLSDPDSGLGFLRDIDLEVANNPAALISKIKEILKVRPRKDENVKGRTRIPAPAALHNNNRSKSVSSLYSSQTETFHNLGSPQQEQVKDMQGESEVLSVQVSNEELGVNQADGAKDISELSRSWATPSDSGNNQNSFQTPLLKLTTPLTTGRSTLIGRRVDRLGHGQSQEKETGQDSSSNISSPLVVSPSEDGVPEFV